MSVHSILIVDDEPNQRLMLEQALRAPDQWSIVTATNGQEAFDYILATMPDVIITDYNMSAMNGIELISRVRASGITSRVILMTAYSSQDLVEAAQGLNVDHYLTKPVPLALLRRVTADTVARASHGDG